MCSPSFPYSSLYSDSASYLVAWPSAPLAKIMLLLSWTTAANTNVDNIVATMSQRATGSKSQE